MANIKKEETIEKLNTNEKQGLTEEQVRKNKKKKEKTN